MPSAPRHAIFTGHRSAPGQHPVEVLVTASSSPEDPWFVRLRCVDERACEIATWGFSRSALLDALTSPVTSEGVTVQPLGFALMFALSDGVARGSLVQIDRAEVASFLVGLVISDL
ncbi:SsgA family sporulation/cell division regulator [Streptomyces spectabilis]|uniref:SsgA family sporulation/cell division regulator n=1 Tax=Streptomyces spectabilis TaxID=68270 RepID=UPI0033DF5864